MKLHIDYKGISVSVKTTSDVPDEKKAAELTARVMDVIDRGVQVSISDLDRAVWNEGSAISLNRAYGDDEPDYTKDAINE